MRGIEGRVHPWRSFRSSGAMALRCRPRRAARRCRGQSIGQDYRPRVSSKTISREHGRSVTTFLRLPDSALAAARLAFGRIDFSARLRRLLDALKAGAAAGWARQLGRSFACGLHGDRTLMWCGFASNPDMCPSRSRDVSCRIAPARLRPWTRSITPRPNWPPSGVRIPRGTGGWIPEAGRRCPSRGSRRAGG